MARISSVPKGLPPALHGCFGSDGVPSARTGARGALVLGRSEVAAMRHEVVGDVASVTRPASKAKATQRLDY